MRAGEEGDKQERGWKASVGWAEREQARRKEGRKEKARKDVRLRPGYLSFSLLPGERIERRRKRDQEGKKRTFSKNILLNFVLIFEMLFQNIPNNYIWWVLFN